MSLSRWKDFFPRYHKLQLLFPCFISHITLFPSWRVGFLINPSLYLPALWPLPEWKNPYLTLLFRSRWRGRALTTGSLTKLLQNTKYLCSKNTSLNIFKQPTYITKTLSVQLSPSWFESFLYKCSVSSCYVQRLFLLIRHVFPVLSCCRWTSEYVCWWWECAVRVWEATSLPCTR